MSMFAECPDCGTQRLAAIHICPVCQARATRSQPTICSHCASPMTAGRCPHCDQPCDILTCTICRPCANATNDLGRQMSRQPHPGDRILRDARPTHCARCGQPLLDTSAGPWCPTPFCGQ